MWNKIKFYLGMKCVATKGDKWVVTRREALILRVCRSKNVDYWYMTDECIDIYCLFDSEESAKEFLHTITKKSKSSKIKPQ